VQGIIFKKIIHTIYGEVNNVFTVYIKGGCEYNKTEICKMAASRFVKVTDKEISELKINSVPKNTKDLCKILKQLFASGSVIIREYSP
jgi:hypothetical protein